MIGANIPPPVPNKILKKIYAVSPIKVEANAVAKTLCGTSGKSFVYRLSLTVLRTSIVNAVVMPIRIAFNRKARAIVVPRKFIKGLNPINKSIEKKC